MRIDSGTQRLIGVECKVGGRVEAAKFALSKEVKKVLPPTRLYWSRDWKGCCG
jgi:hypothetical protein